MIGAKNAGRLLARMRLHKNQGIAFGEVESPREGDGPDQEYNDHPHSNMENYEEGEATLSMIALQMLDAFRAQNEEDLLISLQALCEYIQSQDLIQDSQG